MGLEKVSLQNFAFVGQHLTGVGRGKSPCFDGNLCNRNAFLLENVKSRDHITMTVVLFANIQRSTSCTYSTFCSAATLFILSESGMNGPTASIAIFSLKVSSAGWFLLCHWKAKRCVIAHQQEVCICSTSHVPQELTSTF